MNKIYCAMRNKMHAFSLAEALIVMLIVAIVALISTPMITKKRAKLDANAVHGKWACYRSDDGNEYMATAKDIDAPFGSWRQKCVFPMLPKSVKYLWVEVFGSGGGGSRGYASPWADKPINYNWGDQVKFNGIHDVAFTPWSSYYNQKSPSWLELNKVYMMSTGSELYQHCASRSGSSPFYKVKYVEGVYGGTFGTCKSFTKANDLCKSGDAGQVGVDRACIKSEWIDDTSKEKICKKETDDKGEEIEICEYPKKEIFYPKDGTYCVKGTSNWISMDPASPLVPSDLVDDCLKGGHPYCKHEGDKINIYKQGYECETVGSLPYIHQDGYSSVGIQGALYLKKGEKLAYEITKEGKKYPSGTSGGYKYSDSKDGDEITLFHYKAVSSGKEMSYSKLPIAVFTGPSAGSMGTSGDYCCSNCKDVAGYSYSSGKSTPCTNNATAIKVKIMPAYQGTFTETINGSSYIRITSQEFESFNGCHGSNGRATASLVPSSGTKAYTFYVGKGGEGAKGAENNIVYQSATRGEQTFFSWVAMEGGAPAADSCNTSSSNNAAREKSVNKYNSNLGLGGKKGFVSKNNPERNYDVAASDDVEPNGRWTVNDAGNGTGGMVVVSW